ncbi:MAG: FCD domain-containing protein, partial [Herbaspirillum sp.]
SLETRELLEPLEMIIDLNPGTLEALFDARLIIETGVAALAAIHIDDAELARLARNVEDEARLLSDPAAFSAADVEFHEAIIEACNNPFLQSVAGSLYMLGKKSRSITSRIPSTLERSLQDHRDILDALKARNPHQASEAMRNHLLRVRDAYRSAGRSQNESVHD